MQPLNSNQAGVCIMLSTALIFSVGDTLYKVYSPELTVWQVGLARFALGLLCVPIIASSGRIRLKTDQKIMMFWRGFIGTIGFTCLMAAIKMLPLAEAMIIFYSYPAFAALLGPLINKEKTQKREWPAIFLAFAGASLVVLANAHINGHLSLGHGLALFASMGAATSLNIVRRLGKSEPPVTIYFYFCVIGFCMTIWPFISQPEPLLPDQHSLVGLALFSFFYMAGQLTMNYGFKYMSAANGSVILMSEVLLASLASVFFLGEELTIWLVAGGGMIFTAGYQLSTGCRWWCRRIAPY